MRPEVVIPDLWGKSSDDEYGGQYAFKDVVIPDLWGKSSDKKWLRI